MRKQASKKSKAPPTPTAQATNQQSTQHQNTSWAGVHHQLYQAEDMKE
jgi:hypothetical protein